MKSFLSFLSKLFVHALVWATLLYGLLHPAPGYENLAVFYVGMTSAMSIISMFASGGLRTIDVPGSFVGRAVWWCFHWSGSLLALALIEHGHFVSAAALVAWLGLKWAAYREARRFENAIKRQLKMAAEQMKAFDEQVAAGNGMTVQASPDAKPTTVKVNPNAARDPAFGYPFSPKDIAATSA
jgi:hypothetical protein